MIYSTFVFLLLYSFSCRYNNNYYNFADFFVTIMIITLAKGHYCHYTSQSIISMLLLYTKNAHGYYYYYTYSRSRPGVTTVWRNQKNVDGVARLTINARSL